MRFTQALCLLLFYQYKAHALETCWPTSCNASCGTTCTYFVCGESRTHSFTATEIPFSNDEVPNNACEHTTLPASAIPFTVDGVTYPNLPAEVTHSYKVCKPEVIQGPPCS